MKLDSDDEGFASHVRQWLETLSDDVLVDFERVMRASPGYYPTTILDFWPATLAGRGLQASESSSSLAEVVALPVGHPLDFDWRFSPATLIQLIDVIAELSKPDQTIAYFGTPTLFVEALEKLPTRRHSLVDANAAMVSSIASRANAGSTYHLRLGADQLPPNLHADIVVLDPPWYPDSTEAFMASAAAILAVGGRLLVSQPTFATRPGVEAEREDLLVLALGLGLQPIEIAVKETHYLTPHFERMSLGAMSAKFRVPDAWRPGDLLTFEKVHEIGRTSAPARATARDPWLEVPFGPVRIKLRAAGLSDLEPVSSGVDRLATVSRRDPLRSSVGFWTSGNRVRTLQHVDELAVVIAACHSDLQNMSFTLNRTRNHAEAANVETRVADVLFDLLLLEYQEHVAGGYGALT